MIDRQILLVLPCLCWGVACGPSDKYLSADSDKDGYSVALDCDDGNPNVHPNAAEICNGIDDNCNSFVDDADAALVTEHLWYRDSDGDGYGRDEAGIASCQPPSGYVANSLDCNDAQPTVNPDGIEACNEIDDDCDGAIDDAPADGRVWYLDADGDGYGVPGETVVACSQPLAYADNADDCDDFDSSIFPDAIEICDLKDNNCNGALDAEDPFIDTSTGVWMYPDNDGDGFGIPGDGIWSCFLSSGYSDNTTDCDDNNAAVNPASVEICDGLDNDCLPQTTEQNMVSEMTLEGWFDVSSLFSNGSLVPIQINQPTTLLFCEGIFDVAFDIQADLFIDTAAENVIFRSEHHRIFSIRNNATLDLEGIDLEDSIGALDCESAGLVMRDARIQDLANATDPLFDLNNCDLSFENIILENNVVSANSPILEAQYSDLSLASVLFSDNSNGQGSTGIYLNQSSMILNDSQIIGQQGGHHRGVLLNHSSLECLASGNGTAGIFDTITGGAESQTVALQGNSIFTSSGCEFGALYSAGASVNAKVLVGTTAYGPVGVQDIACDSTGCSGTITSDSTNNSFLSTGLRYAMVGNVYQVTGNPTLLEIDIPVEANGHCDTELGVWTRSYSTSPWTLRWSEQQSYWSGTQISFSAPGIMLKDGEELGLGLAWACDPNVTMQVYETGSGLSGPVAFTGLRLSSSGYVGQPLSNIGLQQDTQLRQMSHSLNLWEP